MTDHPEDAAAALLPGEKPTLKTIARISGLAVPTVSRALSDAPDIKRETKELIRNIANQIGYVPNRAGVRLRTGRTNVISLILAPQEDMLNHVAQLISSIAQTLRGTPYHLIVNYFFHDEDPMKPVRYIVETGSADAVILNQTQDDDPRVRYLLDHHVPFATHGRTKWADQHAYYDYDNGAYGEIAVRELVKRGRTKILMVAPPKAQLYGVHMVDGATRAAKELGVDFRVSKRLHSDLPGAEAEAKMVDILQEDPTIDAIICGSTNATMGSIAAAESAGRHIGKDIDIVGKEAIPFLKLFRKEVLVLPENVRKAGEFLAQAAMQAIREPDAPPMQGLEVPSESDII